MSESTTIHCARLACWLTAGACARRQGREETEYTSCRRCPQGADVLVQLRGAR